MTYHINLADPIKAGALLVERCKDASALHLFVASIADAMGQKDRIAAAAASSTLPAPQQAPSTPVAAPQKAPSATAVAPQKAPSASIGRLLEPDTVPTPDAVTPDSVPGRTASVEDQPPEGYSVPDFATPPFGKRATTLAPLFKGQSVGMLWETICKAHVEGTGTTEQDVIDSAKAHNIPPSAWEPMVEEAGVLYGNLMLIENPMQWTKDEE